MLYLSVSQRTAFKRCRWQWSWRYKRRLEAKTPAPALRFGTLIHLALEKYYKPGIKRGPHPAKTFLREYERELKEQMIMGFRDDDGHWQEAGELGVKLLNAYVDHYKGDPEWEVLVSEQHFEMPIFNEAGEQIATAVGAIDGVWRHRTTGKVVLVDHKTAAQISTGHLLMDDQAGQYMSYGVDWLIKQGLIKAPPDEIIFNFLRKQAPPSPETLDDKGRKLNKDGSVSKSQPAPIFERYPTPRAGSTIKNIKRRVGWEAQEVMDAQAGRLHLTKSASMFNCRMCAVRDICELHEAGADWQSYARATMKRRKETVIEEAIEYEHAH